MGQEAADDRRATAEATKAYAERLVEIEAEKLSLPPNDPRMPQLAAEATAIAERIVQDTRAEEELAGELEGDSGP